MLGKCALYLRSDHLGLNWAPAGRLAQAVGIGLEFAAIEGQFFLLDLGVKNLSHLCEVQTRVWNDRRHLRGRLLCASVAHECPKLLRKFNRRLDLLSEELEVNLPDRREISKRPRARLRLRFEQFLGFLYKTLA